ncbi:MAG: type II secretion system protein [Ruminococcus sp.]|nr:type II secretion system protein [Ruminococcus sp.]
MKKLKSKLSGMTLVEMIVALAVFAMLALILVLMGSAVEKNSRAAHDLNSRVAVNGPIAEAQNTNDSFLADNNFVVQVANGKAASTDANGNAVYSYINIEGTLCYVNPTNSNHEIVTNVVTTNAQGDEKVIPDPTLEAGDYVPKYIIVTMPQNATTTTAAANP